MKPFRNGLKLSKQARAIEELGGLSTFKIAAAKHDNLYFYFAKMFLKFRDVGILSVQKAEKNLLNLIAGLRFLSCVYSTLVTVTV